jgi:molybdopterin/thiamine biosynthesis adenylyltransferase
VQRFVRQVLLPEIGEAGQRRLGAATASVAGAGLAHEVAARYAEAAGFGAVAPGPVDVAALAPASVVTTAAAREVLAGARAALAEIRRAALVASEPPPEAAS